MCLLRYRNARYVERRMMNAQLFAVTSPLISTSSGSHGTERGF